MIDRIKESGPGRAASRTLHWLRGWLVPALIRRRAFGAAVFASVLAALYWGLIASDRYVSEAHVVVQRTDIGGGTTFNLGSLLGNATSVNAPDQLLLRDYLTSTDMLRKLDAKLGLRAHYSDWRRDPVSRMWFGDADMERFYQHFLTRVSVEYDDYTGLLSIKAQGYDAKTAQAIAAMLVEEGERFMNGMAHALAKEQVDYLVKQVEEMHGRVMQARNVLIDYQNRYGLVSPQGTAENVAAIVNRLESQLTDLQTRRAAMLGYLVPESPNVAELNLEIAAIEKQIRQEKGRLAAPAGNGNANGNGNGKAALNRRVEEFQRLQMTADLTQDMYKTALVALENGRIEATRTLKKVSVVQRPSLPQYPLEPRRIYNTIVFTLVALILAGTLHLLAAIIRDHKD